MRSKQKDKLTGMTETGAASERLQSACDHGSGDLCEALEGHMARAHATHLG